MKTVRMSDPRLYISYHTMIFDDLITPALLQIVTFIHATIYIGNDG